jgi:hypothetical protein
MTAFDKMIAALRDGPESPLQLMMLAILTTAAAVVLSVAIMTCLTAPQEQGCDLA